jgi:hypothetical protein
MVMARTARQPADPPCTELPEDAHTTYTFTGATGHEPQVHHNWSVPPASLRDAGDAVICREACGGSRLSVPVDQLI